MFERSIAVVSDQDHAVRRLGHVADDRAVDAGGLEGADEGLRPIRDDGRDEGALADR